MAVASATDFIEALVVAARDHRACVDLKYGEKVSTSLWIANPDTEGLSNRRLLPGHNITAAVHDAPLATRFP